jgi:arabinofuranosyltransferase
MKPLSTPILQRSLVFLLLITLLFTHSAFYIPYMPDDAFISFQYAKRFAAGLGLTWTNGAPVEGYSNLLWVLLLGIIGSLGVDIVEGARLLGLIASAGTVLAFLAVPYRKAFDSQEGLKANTIASIFFVSSGVIACWSVAGLEQALLGTLLAWGIIFSYRLLENPNSSGYVLASLFALLALVRPDTPLFGVVASVYLATLFYKLLESPHASLRVGIWTLTAVAAVTAARLLYYGDWVPNTAHIKLSLTSHYLWQGVRYVYRGYCLNFVPLLGFLAALFISIKYNVKRTRIFFLTVLLVAWSTYLIIMGGDVNPPARHFVPIIIICCFGIGEFFEWYLTQNFYSLKKDLARFLPLALFFHLVLQYVDPELREAGSPKEFHVEDSLAAGVTLKRAFLDQQPLLALDGAGAVPFASELPVLDLLGLNDATIARTSPKAFGNKEFGSGWLGHELGSTDYVLKRLPDIILFGSYKGTFEGGKALVRDPRFKQLYCPLTLEVVGKNMFTMSLYARREGKIGFSIKHNKITIPPYLSEQHPLTFLTNMSGKPQLVTHITSPTIYTVSLPSNVSMVQKQWQIETDPPLPIQLVETYETLTGSSPIVTVVITPPVNGTLFLRSMTLSWKPRD